MAGPGIKIPGEEIAALCRRHHIRRLALFGSVLRDDFGPESDVDVLVELESEARVGYFKLVTIQDELAEMLGHEVDLPTPGALSRYFRQKVLDTAEVIYERERQEPAA